MLLPACASLLLIACGSSPPTPDAGPADATPIDAATCTPDGTYRVRQVFTSLTEECRRGPEVVDVQIPPDDFEFIPGSDFSTVTQTGPCVWDVHFSYHPAEGTTTIDGSITAYGGSITGHFPGVSEYGIRCEFDVDWELQPSP